MQGLRRKVSLHYPDNDLLTLTAVLSIALTVNMADESQLARTAEEGESSLSR